MYESTSTFLQSELNYRADRLKSGISGSRRRSHGRVSLVRRPAESVDSTR